MSDRRRQPRHGVSLRAHQHLGARRIARQVSQLGARGYFVEDPGTATRAGELIVMELEEPGEASAPTALRVTGEVAHVSERGFGVRITRADWDRLGELIERASRPSSRR